jgi:hypothetical protein
MLQGIQSEISQFRGVRVAEDAENTAVMFGVESRILHRARRCIGTKKHRTGKPEAS